MAVGHYEFGEAVAFICQGLHRQAVSLLHPDRQHAWPCLQGHEFSSWATPHGELIVVLSDTPGATTGSGTQGLETEIPRDGEDQGHFAARAHFDLRDSDAVFRVPLRVVSGERREIWAGWEPEDRKLLLLHSAHNIPYNERHLGIHGRRPPMGATDRSIADLVFRDGPLTAGRIEARLPRACRTSEPNIRRIFSRKLIPHYGFTNPRNGTGYRAPAVKTW